METPEPEDSFKVFNCRCTPEPIEPSPATLVGGPYCGLCVPRGLNKRWNYCVPDRDRDTIHTYERRSPNDPNFYYKRSEPVYHIGGGLEIDRNI